MRWVWIPGMLMLGLCLTLHGGREGVHPTLVAATPPPILRVESGMISGLVVDQNAEIRAYRGIPYAAPPIGELRWRPPQPPPRWDGVRACTELGPACPQPPGLFEVPEKQSEDCLYLNVWTSWQPGEARRPVMLWIHGGGCSTGSGSVKAYDGTNFARLGVILVTINYRLGPFGFLAHPLLTKESDHHVSGNYGLLDQIEALRWVRRNIAAFGGDPDCVTIFGESAGALCIARLMASPLARGLFHRAIAQSGGALGRNRHIRKTWYGLEAMEEVGLRIEESLGCKTALDRLAALRAVPAGRLLAASSPVVGLLGKGTKFGPIVDGYVVPDDPADAWLSGKLVNVPFLAGSNADEGTIFLGKIPVERPLGYFLFVRTLFPEHVADVTKMFPARRPVDVRPAINKLLTVSGFVQPARFMVRAMGSLQSGVYLYQFTRAAPGRRLHELGAFHSLEIAYVFGNFSAEMAPEDRDRALSESMSRAWVRFALSGNPNGDALGKWPSYERTTDQHFIFGDVQRAGSHLYERECDLFDLVERDRRSKREEAGVSVQ